jgi:hypothetical protein
MAALSERRDDKNCGHDKVVSTIIQLLRLIFFLDFNPHVFNGTVYFMGLRFDSY